jgi:hypothetical protein
VTPISYVVVSTPRSATGYTAKVLTTLGLDCGHEEAFRPGKPIYHRATKGIWGDASWLAVPHISALPPGTLVLHQVRNPISNLDSMMARRQLRGKITPDGGRPRGEYTNFLIKHFEGWEELESQQVRLLTFWVKWHQRIEDQAKNPKNRLRYFRFRVEEMDEEQLLGIVAAIGAPAPEAETLQLALETSKRTNHRRGPSKWSEAYMQANGGELVEQVQLLSGRYGYTR